MRDFLSFLSTETRQNKEEQTVSKSAYSFLFTCIYELFLMILATAIACRQGLAFLGIKTHGALNLITDPLISAS